MINEQTETAYNIAADRIAKSNGKLGLVDALLSVTKSDIDQAAGNAPEEDFIVNDERLHRQFAKAAERTARSALSVLADERRTPGMSETDALLTITQNDYDLHYKAAYKLQIERALQP